MEGDAGRGLECQKTMDGKESNASGPDKAVLPSCCLKARACDPEPDAKSHSTVCSGWFSKPRSPSGQYNIPLHLFFQSLLSLFCFIWVSFNANFKFYFFYVMSLLQVKMTGCCISTIQCGQVFPLILISPLQLLSSIQF